MSLEVVEIAMSDADIARLDQLAQYFSGGDRSEFLRLAMKRMAREKFANRFREIQAIVHQELGVKPPPQELATD